MVAKRKNDSTKDKDKPVRQTKPPLAIETFFSNIKKSVVKYMTNLGAHIFYLGRHSVKLLAKGSLILLLSLFGLLKNSFKSLVKVLKRFVRWCSNPYVCTKEYCYNLKALMSERYKKKGIVGATKLLLSSIGTLLYNARGVFITMFNYAAPVVSVLFLINLVQYSNGIDYGVSVEYNGEVLGVIEGESVYNQANKLMQDRITYVDDEEAVVINPKFTITALSNTTDIIGTDELADKMISNSDVQITTAFGFYVNDTFMGAVVDKEKIEDELDRILNSHKTDKTDATISFVDDFTFKRGLYIESSIIDENEVITLFNGTKQEEAYYTVVEGDAPTLIAQKNGIPYSDLLKLNPDIETVCVLGQKVLLNKEIPYLSYQITYTEKYTTSINFKTERVNDSTRYKDQEVVTRNGTKGEASVVAEVTEVNGYETNRKIISSEVTKEPVSKKISVGTKVYKPASSAQISQSKGKFMWPVGGSGGYISTYLYGYPGHKGIDIAGIPQGTPVYAAASGVVTEVVHRYDYGKMVKISHGDGFETWYAHNSQTLVSVGTSVSKGDLIALVGSTGKSTGNHLHFEVRYYGSIMNPTNYL